MEDVASDTMSLVYVSKTKRCSGFGDIVADASAKGEPKLLDRMGLVSPKWLRPSLVLMDWVNKPVVTPCLGQYLLNEISQHMEVVLPTSCRSSFENII